MVNVAFVGIIFLSFCYLGTRVHPTTKPHSITKYCGIENPREVYF